MRYYVAIVLLCSQIVYANMYHINLLSDKVPDLSSIEAFGEDIGDNWPTNNEKAIILGYWIDQLTTYAEPLYFSRQWDDPIAFINNNEYGMCSDMTMLMNTMGEGAFGFMGRRHELSDLHTPIEHTVPEIYYDDTWHFFDPSFGNAYGLHDNGIVTSLEAYALNPYYSRYKTPAALTKDSDGDGYIKAWLSSDEFGWSIDRMRHDEYSPDLTWGERETEGYYGVHRFDISIEDYEFYTRYWHHLDGLEGFNKRDFFWPHYNYSDSNNYTYNDIDDRIGEHRGNGLWVYEPDLTDESAYESSFNLYTYGQALYPTELDVEGEIVFKIDSANFTTGVLVEADLFRENEGDSVIIEASSSGGNYWFPVWENKAVGDLHIVENISNMIKGTLQSQDIRHVTDYMVRVRLNTVSGLRSAQLKSMKISTVTMLNKSALPKLMLGKNEITIQETNSGLNYQTKSLNPVLTKLESGANDEIFWQNIELWKLYTKLHHNFTAAENYGNMYTSLWKTSSQKGWITYELDAPRAIKKARIGGSFVIREESDDSFVIKYRVYNGQWHEWQEVSFYNWNTRNNSANRENQAHLEEWHIWQENVTKVEFMVEAFNYPHINALHMEIDYLKKETEDKPLYITYNWTEFYEDVDGHLPQDPDEGITRTYSEKITQLPHTFTINTGGDIQPQMNWVSMNLEGNHDPVNNTPLGYSDGQDRGDNDLIPMFKYEIGNEIAIGKDISLSSTPYHGLASQLVDGRIIAASNGERGNEGGGKVEVQIDEEDIVKFSEGIDVLEVTIDLGSVKTVGGVRVDAYKPEWEAYFPDSIVVETAVDNNFVKRAEDAYNSAKYAHNLWPVDWALPKNAYSKNVGRFPNYGLLSNYVFIPFDAPVEARYIRLKIKEQNINNEEKGLSFSEIHVYDKLIAHQWLPRLKHANEVLDQPAITTVEMEAETGDLSDPMRSNQGNQASQGAFITTDYGSGSASFRFNVESTDDYRIWARYIAPDGGSDSFYVQIDDGAEDIWDMHPNSEVWKWGKVAGRSEGGNDRVFRLTKGAHTLHIRGRESGSKLDTIIITNDTMFTPQNPPLITEETHQIEAESAQLDNPMYIRDDHAASNGTYIVNDYGSGQAAFSFTVQNSDMYSMWARYIAKDGESDSFYIQMDDGVEDIWDMHPNSSEWHWTEVAGRENSGVLHFQLDEGMHTLYIRGREGGASLDQLVITNDSAFVPEDQIIGEKLEIEAEDAVLTHPMVLVDDNSASNAQYITNHYGSGSAYFTFNVIEEGSYKLRARFNAPDGESDSFFIKMDNGITDIWDMHPNSSSWKSGFVSGRINGGEYIYNLTVGRHTVVVEGREGGSKLDKLTLIRQ